MSGRGSSGGRFSQDAVSGAVVIALGIAILVALSRIPAAKYQQIAPDLFPRVCAYALVIGGGVLLLRGLIKGGGRFALPHYRGPALVVLAWHQALGHEGAQVFGYAPAGLLTMIISGLAAPEIRFRQLALVSICLIAFSILLFSYALKLPVPILALPGFGP